jgi:hypothetical protein
MTTKITVMFDVPQDPDAFEVDYHEQVALAATIPHLQRIETHSVWPTGHDSPVLAYRLVELFFQDRCAVGGAMGSQQAEGFFPRVFGLGSGGVHIVLHDLESRDREA